MNIPIELFSLFIGTSIALAIFGFLRNPQIPAMLVFGGIFILSIVVSTDNIIMGFLENSFVEPNTIYEVLTNTATANLNSVTPIRAEYPANSASQLIGETFDCIVVPLQKIGSPPVGTLLTIGIFGTNATTIKSFGTLNVTNISTGFFFYEACLNSGDTYTIGTLPLTEQRIGVMYNGGDASNRILVRTDGNNPFDSTNTVLTTFTAGSYTDTTNSDLSMTLYLRGHENGFDNVNYQFTEFPKTIFALLAVIFMLTGGLMVFTREER